MAGIEVQVAEALEVPAALEAVVVRAAAAAIAASGAGDGSLTIVLAGDDELARLNLEYRGVDGPTDVLSFESEDDFPGAPEEMRGYLGDVIISLPRAKEQAEAAGHSLERELALLAAHGTLHLLGYDHAGEEHRQAMWSLQDRATNDATG